jgi:hypothetical protein
VEGPVAPLSDFNTILNQVLALAEATTTEFALLLQSVEWHRCQGKLRVFLGD